MCTDSFSDSYLQNISIKNLWKGRLIFFFSTKYVWLFLLCRIYFWHYLESNSFTSGTLRMKKKKELFHLVTFFFILVFDSTVCTCWCKALILCVRKFRNFFFANTQQFDTLQRDTYIHLKAWLRLVFYFKQKICFGNKHIHLKPFVNFLNFCFNWNYKDHG